MIMKLQDVYKGAYTLTDKEIIDTWYEPSMHSILSRAGVSNYVMYFDTDHQLMIRVYTSGAAFFELPVPDDAMQSFPWPALLVTIKLHS